MVLGEDNAQVREQLPSIHDFHRERTVCVTGAAGFIGSWLVMRLLERGYTVRATVRDTEDPVKTKHLLDLPEANERLILYKADMDDEGSFDAAIDGCEGVFHLATRTVFESRDPEIYFASKTLAERAAWEFAEKNNIDLISIIPPLVVGPFISQTMPPSMKTALALLTRNEPHYAILRQVHLVHLDDLCMSHIFLYEHPEAKGRYISSSDETTIVQLAQMLAEKYPEYNIPTKFKDADESLQVVPFSTKKLLDLGFKFKYTKEEMFDGAIRCCKENGLLP